MSFIASHVAVGRRFVLCAVAALAASGCARETARPTPVDPPDTTPPPPVRTFALNPTTISISDTVGSARPPKGTAAVSATSAASVGGLGVARITYGSGATDWLIATLSSSESPATLTLEAKKDTAMMPGNYTAIVDISSGNASNSPQNIVVNFTLTAAPPPPRPIPITGAVIMLTGNLGGCGGSLQQASANVVANNLPDALFMIGDLAEPRTGEFATLQDFMDCYDPIWGRFKAITYAAVGDREQDTTTGPNRGFSHGFDAYFGPQRGGPPGTNWYSFDMSGWHIIVMNVISGGPLAPNRYNNGSVQLNWLRNDLAANRNTKCVLAIWHDPMWMSGSDPGTPTDPNPKHSYRNQPIRGVWIALRDYNADLVVNGGRHIYERFAAQRYDGSYENPSPTEYAADSLGVVQISSGLGGDGPLQTPPAQYVHPLSLVRRGGNGVLKLTLGVNQYQWEFLNTQYSTIQDWGTGQCH